MSVNLHLPWYVDAETASEDEWSANVVVSDAEGGIAFCVLFCPTEKWRNGPDSKHYNEDTEEYARAVAQAICDRMNGGGEAPE